MESIRDLREICQTTRPAIYRDFLSQFYYKVSIYFTWILLHLRMSANQVTVFSGMVSVLGGILLASDSPYIVLLGALCFHMFAILDMCDGEVARYRKEGGITGHYLDWFMHFITPTAFMLGLFLASLDSLTNNWLVGLGVLSVTIPLFDKSTQNVGWTVIAWTLMRDKKNEVGAPCDRLSVEEQSASQMPKILRRIRFLALSPFQERWSSIIIVLLALGDIFAQHLELQYINYRLWWLIYVGVVGPIYLSFKVRNMVQSDSLQDGCQRLLCPERKIKLPEDDFLG
jgi:hypothetical protein